MQLCLASSYRSSSGSCHHLLKTQEHLDTTRVEFLSCVQHFSCYMNPVHGAIAVSLFCRTTMRQTERERETERECEKRSQLSKSDTTGRGGETRHQRNKSKRKPAKHNGRGGWRAGPRTEEQARGTWHKGAANLWGSRRQDTSTCWGHKSPTSLKGSHRAIRLSMHDFRQPTRSLINRTGRGATTH